MRYKPYPKGNSWGSIDKEVEQDKQAFQITNCLSYIVNISRNQISILIKQVIVYRSVYLFNNSWLWAAKPQGLTG